MKRKLYKFLVPKSIREKVYTANIREFQQKEVSRRRSIEQSIPRVDLSSIYIANLQILIDRNALLNALPHGAVVAQVGVDKGDFASRVLLVTKPQRLHLSGSWAGETYWSNRSIVESTFRAEIKSGQVVISNNRCSSVEELEKFDNHYFDWVYLDTDHSYQHMVRILRVCQMKVKENGIIAGHNYNTGSWTDNVRYGVVEAVNEFCKTNGWEMIYLTHESHRNLSYAIRRMVQLPS